MLKPTQITAGGILVLLSALAVAAPDDEPHRWLQRMSEAMHRLNYDGTFIYEHNGRMQTMRIIHSASEEGEKERLVALSGPSREIVRDGEKVTCILPNDNAVMVEKRQAVQTFPFSVPQQLDRLNGHYRFSMAGTDRIANRPVKHVVIKPLDEYRYGHHLWIDEATGLLLKSELVNEQDVVVEQFLFTSVHFSDKPFPAELLQPQSQGEGLVRYEQPVATPEYSEDASASRWAVRELPPGFRQDVYRRHYMQAIDAPVEHFVFSDGLASISVFIEGRIASAPEVSGDTKLGAVNAYVRPHGDHLITVVGEVPKAAVRTVAESVYRR